MPEPSGPSRRPARSASRPGEQVTGGDISPTRGRGRAPDVWPRRRLPACVRHDGRDAWRPSMRRARTRRTPRRGNRIQRRRPLDLHGERGHRLRSLHRTGAQPTLSRTRTEEACSRRDAPTATESRVAGLGRNARQRRAEPRFGGPAGLDGRKSGREHLIRAASARACRGSWSRCWRWSVRASGCVGVHRPGPSGRRQLLSTRSRAGARTAPCTRSRSSATVCTSAGSSTRYADRAVRRSSRAATCSRSTATPARSSLASSPTRTDPSAAIESDGANVFVGGQFTTVNGTSRRFVASLDPATGARAGASTRTRRATSTAIGLRGNSVYLGGVFTADRQRAPQPVGDGRQDDRRASTTRSTRAPTVECARSRSHPTAPASTSAANTRHRRRRAAVARRAQPDDRRLHPIRVPELDVPVLDLDVDPDGSRVYAALGGFIGAGNRVIGWNAEQWCTTLAQRRHGDVQAVEYVNGEVYFGFHEGYEENLQRHLLATDAATGVVDPDFQPDVNSFWGSGRSTKPTARSRSAASSRRSTASRCRASHCCRRCSRTTTYSAVDADQPQSTGHTSTTATLSWDASTDDSPSSPATASCVTACEVGIQHDADVHRQQPDPVDGLQLRGASRRRQQQRVRADVAGDGHDVAAARRREIELALPRQRLQPGHRVARARHSTTRRGRAATRSSATAKATRPRPSGFGPTPTTSTVTTYFRRTFNVANPAAVTASPAPPA